MASPPPQVRTGTINPSTNVLWSDGTTLFTGYYLFELRIPSLGGTAWTSINVNTNVNGIQVPQFAMIPIVNGTPYAGLGLYYNADLTPPTTQYLAYLYDTSKRQVAGPSSTFTVSAATFTPPTLTPTIPNAYATDTSPDS